MGYDKEQDDFWQKVELVTLLEERLLSNFERRRRRMQAAWDRLKESGRMLAWAVEKDRKHGDLSIDEYLVTHLGFRPAEREQLEEESKQSASQ